MLTDMAGKIVGGVSIQKQQVRELGMVVKVGQNPVAGPGNETFPSGRHDRIRNLFRGDAHDRLKVVNMHHAVVCGRADE